MLKRKGRKPYFPNKDNINQYGDKLKQYILWICSDDLLHSDEQIFEEIFKELPYTKRGNRIRRVIEKEFKLQRNYYFWKMVTRCCSWKSFLSTGNQ